MDSTTSQASQLRSNAAQYMRTNQMDAAQTALESLLRLVPDDATACLQLADVMTLRGQWRASTRPLLQVVCHLPREARPIVELVIRLLGRGEAVAARECLDRMAEATTQPATMLMTQAHLRLALGEIRTASALAARARAAGADAPDDRLVHARLLQYSGEFQAASNVLEECVGRWPDYGDAVIELADLHAHAQHANWLAFADRKLPSLSGAATTPDQQFTCAGYHYMRFKALDTAGRYDEAWSALAQCNRLMHAINTYDAAGTETLTNALLASSDQLHAGTAVTPDDCGPTPIFVVGMPRSGTTLLDRMLSSHSQIASAGEILDFPTQLQWVADRRPDGSQSLRAVAECGDHLDLRAVGRRYLQQTRWRAGARRFYIDKWPLNIQFVAFIRQALPNAPIVHITRTPMDVCFSNFKTLFGHAAEYSYDQRALAHYYGQYARLVSHWRAHLPGAMVEISYADLVQHTAATLRAVLTRCGLTLEDACLHPERNAMPVASPSSIQVREPAASRTDGHWRHYAAHLQTLRDALANIPMSVDSHR